MLSDLAFHLAGAGRDVHVIASRQLYDDADARLPAYEIANGVSIHRVATSRFGRHSLAGRALDYLSFYASAARKLLHVAQRGDVVIAKTDPPLLSVLTWALSFRGFSRVNWLQDLYPEVAAAAGVAGAGGAIGRALGGLRNASLRGAVNVVVGRDMAARLGGHLHIIENWADDEAFAPGEPSANPLRGEWGLSDKFVVAYSGNLGRAHDIDTVLAAANRLRGHSEIVFLVVGGGHGLAAMQARVKSLGLANVLFQPYQPRENLSRSLGAGDMHWLSLKPGFEGLVLPSKFYGIAAAARPMLVIGSPHGELGKLVREYDCGHAVAPGEGEALAGHILALSQDRARAREMGSHARAMLDARFGKARALGRWRELLDAASSGR